jgi:hypothetical protein
MSSGKIIPSSVQSIEPFPIPGFYLGTETEFGLQNVNKNQNDG